MADEVVIATRLLGKEDVAWDTAGNAATYSYTDGEGNQHSVSMLNASHIPVPNGIRPNVGGANIAAALDSLAKKIQTGGALDKDTMVEFISTDGDTGRQTKVNSQLRNLGGHTLTFKFRNNSNLTFSDELVFTGFYNGVLVIDINGIEISTIQAQHLFRIKRCACSVIFTSSAEGNGIFDYDSSPSCVLVEDSVAANFEKITFSDPASVAIEFRASDGVIADTCVFANTQNPISVIGALPAELDMIASAAAQTEVEAHNLDASAHGGPLLSIAGGTQMMEDHNVDATAHDGVLVPINGGTITNPTIIGGTIASGSIVTATGGTINGGVMSTPTINGGTLTGVLEATDGEIDGCTISAPKIILGSTDQTNIVNSVISGGSLHGATINSNCLVLMGEVTSTTSDTRPANAAHVYNAVKEGYGLNGSVIPVFSGGIELLDSMGGTATSTGNYEACYQQIPGGIMIQWGNASTLQENKWYRVRFPQNFTAYRYSIAVNGGDGKDINAYAMRETVSSFLFHVGRTSEGVQGNLSFIAIGW